MSTVEKTPADTIPASEMMARLEATPTGQGMGPADRMALRMALPEMVRTDSLHDISVLLEKYGPDVFRWIGSMVREHVLELLDGADSREEDEARLAAYPSFVRRLFDVEAYYIAAEVLEDSATEEEDALRMAAYPAAITRGMQRHIMESHAGQIMDAVPHGRGAVKEVAARYVRFRARVIIAALREGIESGEAQRFSETAAQHRIDAWWRVHGYRRTVLSRAYWERLARELGVSRRRVRYDRHTFAPACSVRVTTRNHRRVHAGRGPPRSGKTSQDSDDSDPALSRIDQGWSAAATAAQLLAVHKIAPDSGPNADRYPVSTTAHLDAPEVGAPSWALSDETSVEEDTTMKKLERELQRELPEGWTLERMNGGHYRVLTDDGHTACMAPSSGRSDLKCQRNFLRQQVRRYLGEQAVAA